MSPEENCRGEALFRSPVSDLRLNLDQYLCPPPDTGHYVVSWVPCTGSDRTDSVSGSHIGCAHWTFDNGHDCNKRNREVQLHGTNTTKTHCVIKVTGMQQNQTKPKNKKRKREKEKKTSTSSSGFDTENTTTILGRYDRIFRILTCSTATQQHNNKQPRTNHLHHTIQHNTTTLTVVVYQFLSSLQQPATPIWLLVPNTDDV